MIKVRSQKGSYMTAIHNLIPYVPPNVHHQSAWSCIALATLTKPAMLLPATRLGNSPSAAGTYSLAVLRPLRKAFFMMPLSLASTSSEVQLRRCEVDNVSMMIAQYPKWRWAIATALEVAWG